MASPSPKLASIDNTFLLEVTGSAVNKIPAACGKTIFWMTTDRWTFLWSNPFCIRYITARSVKSDAQHLLMCFSMDSFPIMFKYVSCCPSKDAVGRSPTVALERKSYAVLSHHFLI